jgi:hypothetical protein
MTAPRTVAGKDQANQPACTIYITRFRSITEPRGEDDSYADWDELCADFETNYDEIESKADGQGWSPATFTADQRSMKNVKSVSCLVLDYDSGKTNAQSAFEFWSWTAFESLEKKVSTTACLVHTSFSHTPEKPKFRVVMPFSRPVDANEFRAIWNYAANQAEKAGHEIDPACKDPSRMWLLPACRPGGKPAFLVHDDTASPLDVRRMLKECGYKAKTPVHGSPTTVLSLAEPAFDDLLDQIQRAPQGERNATLNRASFMAGRYVGAGRLDHGRTLRELADAGVAAGLDIGEVQSTVERALERGIQNPWKGKRQVKLCGDLHEQIAETMHALADHPALFVKDGSLVVVSTCVSGVTLTRVEETRVQEMMSECADWLTQKNGESSYEKRSTPPRKLALAMVKRGAWEHIKELRAVTSFPVLDAAGNLQAEYGYDSRTQLFCAVGIDVAVAEHPTLEDAKAAVAILSDLVSDFPFPDDTHKSAWVAALLSPLSRYMHDGNIPLVVIQANDRRVGKSKLAAIISTVVTGKAPATMTHVTNVEEERKRIGSILLAGHPVVLIDNVDTQFGGQNMNALITSRVFEDRVLGKQAVLRAENNTVWIVNGKNMSLAPDVAQRSLHIRLQCNEEKPELRSGFKYPDLEAVVLQRRSELLGAALTILRGYVAAGKPAQNLPSWGSFEPWSKLVRAALVWVGLPDPVLTRGELEDEADTELTFEVGLIEGWEELERALGKKGITAKEGIDCLMQSSRETCPTLREALGSLPLPPGRDLPTPNKLGQLLGKHRRKKRHGKMLEKDGSAKDALRWYVTDAM